MKRIFTCFVPAALLAGLICVGVNRGVAAPPVDPNAQQLADGEVAQESAGYGPPVSLNYATGFEPEQGFTPRDATCWQDPLCVDASTGQCGFIGNGTQGSGPYPEPWAVGGSNQIPTQIEAHIDTVHPYSGTQHLRFSQDLCDESNPYYFAVDARVPASQPQPGVTAPSTYRGMIAIDGLFGTNVFWQPQSNSQGLPTTRTLFYFDGTIYVIDEHVYVPLSTPWDTSGAYQEIAVHHDPCAHYRCEASFGPTEFAGQPCPNGTIDCSACIGGDNDGQPCVFDGQCPGGDCDVGYCAGRVDWYYGGKLLYQGTMSGYAGNTSEQLLIYTDNLPGNVDIDDIVIETGEPCPLVCGNLEIENNNADHEECDGINDSRCPGRCVAPGETGPHGEQECHCIVYGQTCDQASTLPNGTTNAPSHGNWWTFIAEAPAYAVDTCGSLLNGSLWETPITVWTGSCGALEFVAANDACFNDDGVDPLSPCYGNEFAGCTCFATNIGQQYWIEVRQYEQYYWGILRNTTNITLTKRLDCGAVWDGGACCDRVNGTCTDDVAEADCTGLGLAWTLNKFCDSAAVSCVPATGACCDRSPDLGGVCTDGAIYADCQGPNQVWTIDATCADITCTEARGACCNGFTGTCANGFLRSDCLAQGANRLWSQDQLCVDVACDPIPGACCNHINPDPLLRTGVCTNGVIMADCQGQNLTWTKGVTCSQVACVADFQAIPTVSEWGLVVLALMLVILVKLVFGSRRGCVEGKRWR